MLEPRLDNRSTIAITFHTSLNRVPYACADEAGSLRYANGDLVSKYCSVCSALTQGKCNRSASQKMAQKVYAYIAEQEHNLSERRQALNLFFHRCANGTCKRVAEPGYRTCPKCGRRSLDAGERQWKGNAPHCCAWRGCDESTTGKYCRSHAALMVARKRAQKKGV